MQEDYLIKPIDISLLTAQERKTFLEYIPEDTQWSFHQTLENNELDGNTLAIGAWKNEKPVGLALGFVDKTPFLGKVFTLFVDEQHRQKYVGSKLFATLIQSFKSRNCRHLAFIYPAELPTLLALEKILKKNQWEGPRTMIKRYKFDGFTFHPDWLDKPYTFPEGFEEFPWITLKKSERELIVNQIYQCHFDPTVSPFGKDESKIEPLNSLGLRFNGEVIGWMVTHRLARDTIRFSSLYVQKDYSLRRNWTKLLVDSINLQRHSTVQWAIFEINMQQVESAWFNFVERKLAPYAVEITRDLQSWYSFPNL